MKIKWKGILECNMDIPHNWPLKSFIKKENICSQLLEIEISTETKVLIAQYKTLNKHLFDLC